MPLRHYSKVFAIEDAKIAPLTDDSEAGATYGTLIDVPAIKSVGISGEIEVKTLRGDNTKQDSDAVLTNVTAEITHGKLSLDVLAAIAGFTVADTGVTPAQVASALLEGGARLKPFLLMGKTPTGGTDTITGDHVLTLYKCVASSFPEFGFEEEDYRTFSFGVECSPLLFNNRWVNLEFRETAVDLAAPTFA